MPETKIRVGESAGEKLAGGGPGTDSDYSIISGPEYAAREVGPDDVIVREMYLCNDQTDRAFERFTPEYLARFAETLPGKPVLVGHDTRTAPVGRFFRAEVVRVKQTVPVVVQPGRGSKAAAPPGFEMREQEVLALKAGFYVPAQSVSGRELVSHLDSGVYHSVSIGFQYDDLHCDLCNKSYFGGDCTHVLGAVTEDGKVATGTYAGDSGRVEALEGSIVYLGCQPGAQTIRHGPDLIARKALRLQAGSDGEEAMEQKTELAPAQEKAAGDDERVKILETELGEVKRSLAEADKLARRALDDLASELRADLERTGERTELLDDAISMLVQSRSYDRLKKARDEQRQKVLDRIPAGISGIPEGPGATQESAPRWRAPIRMEGPALQI